MNETLSPPTDDLLSRIRYKPSGLNPIEARIAGAILEDPERVVHESITSFAGRTSVSAGSVVRFAKLLGFDGYRELKLAMAASNRESALPIEAMGTTTFRSYMDEQVRATIFAAEELQASEIDKAAAALARARRIDLSATGSSVVVAQSLLFSLTLLGLHARYLPDTAEQSAAAAFLEPGDCLLAISYSGRTRAIVDAAARANNSGATVIAMSCNPRSPLLRHTRIALVLDAGKGKFKTEWPLRTAMQAVSRALSLQVAEQLSDDELRHRRATWSSGRFGMRYESA